MAKQKTKKSVVNKLRRKGISHKAATAMAKRAKSSRQQGKKRR